MTDREYDNWKTTEPDGEDCIEVCSECGCELYEGDDAYKLDAKIMCCDCGEEYCKNKFLYVVENTSRFDVDEYERYIGMEE